MTKFRSRWLSTLALATLFAAASALVGGLAIFGSPPLFKPRPQSSPVIQTDKAAYLAGEAIEISGSGFTPLERVMLQVKHAGGTTEIGAGHEAWFVNADQDGSFTSKWTISSDDDAGVNLVLTAAGSSRATAQAEFARVAAFSTRVRSYKPGDTVQFHASGFNPNQLVTIQVNNQDAFTTQTDQSGQATASLKIPESSSAGSLSVRALAPESGLVSSNIVISDAQAVVSAASVATLFQLDGNASSTYPAGAIGYDWSQVYSDFMGTTINASGTAAINFYTDASLGSGLTEDEFTGGASKDTNDMSAWAYNNSSPQPKADLEHAIAAAYVDPSSPNHTYLYVAADRYDNSGSTTLGVWFLQSSIARSGGKFYNTNLDGSANTSSPAQHVNGDLLLVAYFSSGSATITSFTWNNGFPSTGIPLNSDKGFAIVNTAALDGAAGHAPAVPWPFKSSASGAAANYVQAGEFFEAGVDLNNLFPNHVGPFNFSSFVVETRSSTSSTSTLSDFILGHVSTAPDVAVTKVADSSTVSAGTQVGFTVTVSNVGAGGDLTNVTLDDPLPSGVNWSIDNPVNCGASPCFVITTTAGTQYLSLQPNFTLANNAEISAHIIGNSTGVGTLTNTATVHAFNEAPAFFGNNQATATINVEASTHLIINKEVVNGTTGGTLTAAAFSGTISGGVTATDGLTWTGASTNKTLTTVGSYNVAENPVSGYTASFSADCESTIALNQTKTCTVTNTAQAAHLIINKEVVNGTTGGTLTAAAFSGTISGGVTATDGLTWTGASTNKTLTTVGSYNVAENPVSGYTASYAGCSGTIGLGETKTCTITNTAQPAHLIVNKVVISNIPTSVGSVLTAAAFSGTISGVTAADNQNWSGPSTNKTLTSLGSYKVAEDPHPGYDATFSPDCETTIALGDTKTCTVTNTAQAAHLIIIKEVDNNTNGDGGLTAPSFSGTISGGVTATDGLTWTGALTNKTLTTVGSYNVAEDPHPGYDVSFDAGCSGTIGLGETRTCTVTNKAQKATPGGTTTQLLQDKLTITGLRTGASPAGVVHFRLYKENDNNDGCTDGNEVGNGLNLNRTIDNGVASTGTGVAVGPGTYYWQAEYTGDQYNNGFTTACKSETVTVVN